MGTVLQRPCGQSQLLADAMSSRMKKARIGCSVIVLHDPSDDVYHEFLLVWPVTLTLWVILSPDDDFYEVNLTVGRSGMLDLHLLEPIDSTKGPQEKSVHVQRLPQRESVEEVD